PGSCPSTWTKAGVMVRPDLTANSSYVMALTSPTATNKYRMQVRTSQGQTTTSTASSGSSAIPVWLRVTRAGSNFSAFTSPDNQTWTQLGTTQTLPQAL